MCAWVGPYVDSRGIARMRRGDLNEVLKENLDAVDAALDKHRKRSQIEVPECKCSKAQLFLHINVLIF